MIYITYYIYYIFTLYITLYNNNNNNNNNDDVTFAYLMIYIILDNILLSKAPTYYDTSNY